MYDPVIGRFNSPDSILPDLYDPQALNRFSYCLNNPLIYTDPTGHASAAAMRNAGYVFVGGAWLMPGVVSHASGNYSSGISFIPGVRSIIASGTGVMDFFRNYNKNAGISENLFGLLAGPAIVAWVEAQNQAFKAEAYKHQETDPGDGSGDSSEDVSNTEREKKRENKKRNRDQIGGDLEELIDKEQGVQGSVWGPDQQKPGRTRQRIEDKMREEAEEYLRNLRRMYTD